MNRNGHDIFLTTYSLLVELIHSFTVITFDQFHLPEIKFCSFVLVNLLTPMDQTEIMQHGSSHPIEYVELIDFHWKMLYPSHAPETQSTILTMIENARYTNIRFYPLFAGSYTSSFSSPQLVPTLAHRGCRVVSATNPTYERRPHQS
jgi:hypothetical protein